MWRVPWPSSQSDRVGRAARVRLAGIVAFQSGVLAAALLLGQLVDSPPFEHARLTWGAAGAGVAATAPLLAGLRWALRTSYPPMRRLVRTADQLFGPLFAHASVADLALIALLAGLGEEALFRGVLQPALAAPLGALGALATTSLLFGVAHLVTPAYGLLATVVGLYLGSLMLLGHNLVVPAVAHGLYDFIALGCLVRRHRGRR